LPPKNIPGEQAERPKLALMNRNTPAKDARVPRPFAEHALTKEVLFKYLKPLSIPRSLPGLKSRSMPLPTGQAAVNHGRLAAFASGPCIKIDADGQFYIYI
jgi:hypothetical protein